MAWQLAGSGFAQLLPPVMLGLCGQERLSLQSNEIAVGCRQRLDGKRASFQERKIAFKQLGDERGHAPSVEERFAQGKLKRFITAPVNRKTQERGTVPIKLSVQFGFHPVIQPRLLLLGSEVA